MVSRPPSQRHIRWPLLLLHLRFDFLFRTPNNFSPLGFAFLLLDCALHLYYFILVLLSSFLFSHLIRFTLHISFSPSSHHFFSHFRFPLSNSSPPSRFPVPSPRTGALASHRILHVSSFSRVPFRSSHPLIEPQGSKSIR